MSSHTRQKLTTSEKCLLICKVPLILSSMIIFFLTRTWLQWRDGDFQAGKRRRSLKRNAAASIGILARKLTPKELWALFKSTTGDAIVEYCAQKGLAHSSVVVGGGSDGEGRGFPPGRLHFVDCEPRQKGRVLLYFHGGGYFLPLKSPSFAIFLAKSAGASLVLLEYTLAPQCAYPGQLAQAIASLQFLLQHHPPSDIIIGGESAGGNMALAVLAHIQQPKPGIAPLVLDPSSSSASSSSVGNNFRGLFVISPRAGNGADGESFRYNARRDYMNKDSLAEITKHWKPAADVWAAPASAPKGFWDGLRVDRMLLAVGGDEVYCSDVCHLAQVMGAVDVGVNRCNLVEERGRKDEPTLQLVVCPGEMHCQTNLDISLGIMDGYMLSSVTRWLAGFQLS